MTSSAHASPKGSSWTPAATGWARAHRPDAFYAATVLSTIETITNVATSIASWWILCANPPKMRKIVSNYSAFEVRCA
jgi:hypothetical protein